MIKCVKSQRGYWSCERCKNEGRMVRRSMCQIFETVGRSRDPALFPEPRTDDEFENFAYDGTHQNDLSPIVTSGANVKSVSQFILDYMHCVCLGVMKKLLIVMFKSGARALWAKGKVSERLGSIRLPADLFQRQPRSLDNVERFKATEFRTFMLYTGPVVLKGLINEQRYKHFLNLTVAMSILLDSNHGYRMAKMELARELLIDFVFDAEDIYGPKFISYNTHTLIHIADDVERFRCSLNEISAFPFENHLQRLKKSLKNPRNPVTQLVRKIKGLENVNLDQKTSVDEVVIGTSQQDRYFSLGSKVAVVKEKQPNEEYVCDLYRIEDLHSFFESPRDSKMVDIFHLKNNTNFRRKMLKRNNLCQKILGIEHPEGDGFILLKLRHHA